MSTDFRALCAEHLPELRGMFERILCVARSSDGPVVGNIQLADRLIDAVVSWSESSLAHPEPEPGEVGEPVAWPEIDGTRIRARITVLEPCPVDEWRSIARRAVATLLQQPSALAPVAPTVVQD